MEEESEGHVRLEMRAKRCLDKLPQELINKALDAWPKRVYKIGRV